MDILKVSKDLRDLQVGIDPLKVEQRKNAVFVCETCIKTKYGWSESPVQIYWQEKPPVEGYSNYFALFSRGDQVFIASGESALEEFYGINADGVDGYSRYRHDYRPIGNGGVAIDGGRDYTRIIGSPHQFLVLQIEGPNVVVKKRMTPAEWFTE